MIRRSFLAASGAAFALLVSARADAHFILEAPACYSEQGDYGDPQKAPPCGDGSGDTVTETGEVTTYEAGATITIQIDETIPHPGHYRVQLAADQASLGADPEVTPDSQSDCGSTVIDTTPTLPLVADGLLVHESAFNGPQTVQVKLPDGMTCDHCVLQVAEFMSNHPEIGPGGCFYHHCAIVTIVPPGTAPDAAPGTPDATPASGADAAPGGSDDGDGGCGCRAAGRRGAGKDGAGAIVLLVALAAVVTGRRAGARRRS
jgi:hypothetical protein